MRTFLGVILVAVWLGSHATAQTRPVSKPAKPPLKATSQPAKVAEVPFEELIADYSASQQDMLRIGEQQRLKFKEHSIIRLAEAREELKKIRAGRIDKDVQDQTHNIDIRGRHSFGSLKRKKEAEAKKAEEVANIQIMIDICERARGTVVPELSTRLNVGDKGVLRYAMKVNQVVGEGAILVEYADQTIWLSGMQTEDVVDGDRLVYSKPVAVTGTRAYETVMGAKKTVAEVRPLACDFLPVTLEELRNIAK